MCGALYGAIMAGHAGVSGDRWLMVLYGAIKVPILFGATMLAAVPGFYVIHLLFGVGPDFPRVWRALIDYQVIVALFLFGLAPVTLLLDVSMTGYRTLLGWSVIVFALAAWRARLALVDCYRDLVKRNPIHRVLRNFWFFIYAFVGIQMGWVLRPFVGHPDLPAQFFRDDVRNAYVRIVDVLGMILGDFLGR